MRLKKYGRNANKRKEYVHQPTLLLVGVDVSKAKHRAWMGTQTTMRCRKLECPHTREGFKRFDQTLRVPMGKNGSQRILIAMEPSGISWQALYERLKSYDYEVCLVHCQAVRHNRTTMPDGTSKTDEKDAASICAVLRQGKVVLPVARDPALPAASRLLRRHLALKQRGRPLQNQLRAAMPLTFPELHRMLKAPDRSDEFERKALAHTLAAALGQQHLGLTQAREFLAPRRDFQRRRQLPRLGQPTAAAILTAIGDVRASTNGHQ